MDEYKGHEQFEETPEPKKKRNTPPPGFRAWTAEQLSENGRLAGIASGVARRKKRTMRGDLEAAINCMIPVAEIDPATGDERIVRRRLLELITNGVIAAAMNPKTAAAAYAVIRDTMGEKPIDRVEQTGGVVVNWGGMEPPRYDVYSGKPPEGAGDDIGEV